MDSVPDQIAALQTLITVQQGIIVALRDQVAAIEQRLNTHWHSDVTSPARW